MDESTGAEEKESLTDFRKITSFKNLLRAFKFLAIDWASGYTARLTDAVSNLKRNQIPNAIIDLSIRMPMEMINSKFTLEGVHHKIQSGPFSTIPNAARILISNVEARDGSIERFLKGKLDQVVYYVMETEPVECKIIRREKKTTSKDRKKKKVASTSSGKIITYETLPISIFSNLLKDHTAPEKPVRRKEIGSKKAKFVIGETVDSW